MGIRIEYAKNNPLRRVDPSGLQSEDKVNTRTGPQTSPTTGVASENNAEKNSTAWEKTSIKFVEPKGSRGFLKQMEKILTTTTFKGEDAKHVRINKEGHLEIDTNYGDSLS